MTDADDRSPDAQDDDGARWRLPEGVRLLWKTWGDEVVVFNTSSGQTHLLDPLSGAVLESIEASPMTVAQLTGRLAERFDLAPDADLARRAEAICSRFDDLGLADPDRS
ncbi:MAG: HPr-rel-A system PqqD family peptide chaperone [Alphaproteobacteria bacterium]